MAQPIEYWQEYERRKARIQDIGLTPSEYERAIERILNELDAEYPEEPRDAEPDEESA